MFITFMKNKKIFSINSDNGEHLVSYFLFVWTIMSKAFWRILRQFMAIQRKNSQPQFCLDGFWKIYFWFFSVYAIGLFLTCFHILTFMLEHVFNYYTFLCKLVQFFRKIMHKSQIGLYEEGDTSIKVKGESKLQINKSSGYARTL